MPDALPQWILDARAQVGRSIYARRMTQNMTQERLRDLTGISTDTIQRIEAGREIKISHLFAIARALDIHPADLLR